MVRITTLLSRKHLGSAHRYLIDSGFLIGLLGAIFWVVATWPGYMNPDSALHWEEAITGRYPNWHPTTYSLLVRASQWFGRGDAAILILVQCLVFLVSVCALVSEICQSRLARNLVVFVLLLLPQTGFMLILVGKDGLSASMFILLIGILVRIRARQRVSFGQIFLAFCATAALAMLRWNGPLIVGWTVFSVALIRPKTDRKALIAMLLGLIIGSTWLFYPLPSDNSGAKDLRRGGKALDIAWSLRTDQVSFSRNELDLLDSIAPLEQWSASQANCNNFNLPLLYDVFAENPKSAEALTRSSSEINQIWLNRILKHPINFVEGRICKVKGLVIPARDWWPTYKSTSQETMLKFFGKRIEAQPFKHFSERVASIFDGWGGSSIGLYLSMPLTWIFLIIALAAISKSDRRRTLETLLLAMGVPISIFISGVGVEPRYLWPATALLSILAIGNVANILDRFSKTLLPMRPRLSQQAS